MPRPSDDQLRDLVLAFAEHGITDRSDRIRLCSDHAGRHLTSSARLTPREADDLLGRLRALPKGTDLHRIVAMLVVDEENEAAVRAAQSLTCTRTSGRKGPTAGDLEQVAAFGRFLEQAGPPPVLRTSPAMEAATARLAEAAQAGIDLDAVSGIRYGVDLASDGDVVVVAAVEDDGQVRLL